MKQPWTDEETELALRMIAEKAPPAAFINRLGRTKRSAQSHILYLKERGGSYNPILPWSEEDTLTAIEMLKARAAPEEFVNRLNRTMAAAISRRAYYLKDEAVREMRAKHAPLTSLLTGKNLPPAHVMREAERAMTAPRSLTSLICKDPPPGRSALDQKMAREARA